MSKANLYLCMGSACHQEGVYQVRPVLEELLKTHHLQDKVELMGSLCLGPCRDRIVIRVGDQLIKNITVTNLEQKFNDEILPCLEFELESNERIR